MTDDDAIERGPWAELHPYRGPLDRDAGFPDDWFRQADNEGRLFVGAAPRHREDWLEVLDRGVTHVLNVADDPLADTAWRISDIRLADGHAIGLKRLPFRDDGSIPPDDWFEQGVRYAYEAISAHGVVYVHCLVGSARGPAMAYAILRRLGYSHLKASRAVRAARPRGSHFYLPDARRWAHARYGR